MKKIHEVRILSIEGTRMRLDVDGREFAVDLAEESTRLAQATKKQREHAEISPSGYGLRWPELDEDLSIDGLIGVKHKLPVAKSEA